VRIALWSVVAALGVAAAPGVATASIGLKRIATFREPVQLVRVPGDRRRMVVVERDGVVRLLRDSRPLRRPFLNISSQVALARGANFDHGGLFSVAFAPDYQRSRRLYVFYTHLDGSLRVEEFKRDPRRPERAQPASRRTVLSLPGRSRFDLGGQIAFGPDRLLYVGLGQQDETPAAQELGDLRGKLLRIDPRPAGARPYRIPPGNPFVGRTNVRQEIWALGLRNPFRFSFTPGGSIVIGDVGESYVEEIDVVPPNEAGANLGWSAFEGRSRTDKPGVSGQHTPPVIEHAHSRGYCSIIGGLVVRDRSLSVRGRYLYSDWCLGRGRSVRLGRRVARGDRFERARVALPVAFGEDGRRRVYVVSQRGPVFRLVRR
jgi:glucose/arabinose dehydrogenase